MVYFSTSYRLFAACSLMFLLTACMGTAQQPKEIILGQPPLDCPDWSYAHMANYRNSVLSNYGCAHATNLSKMVLDPNDLIAGKGDARPDAMRGIGIIEAYREPPAPPASQASESLIEGR